MLSGEKSRGQMRRFVLKGTGDATYGSVGRVCHRGDLDMDGALNAYLEKCLPGRAQYSSDEHDVVLLQVEDHLYSCDYVDLYGEDIEALVKDDSDSDCRTRTEVSVEVRAELRAKEVESGNGG